MNIGKIYLIIFSFFFYGICASNDSLLTFFYDSLKNVYLKEYQKCTGDSSNVSFKDLINWKKQINIFVQTHSYKEMLSLYISQKNYDEPILPCKVIKWAQERKKEQNKNEKLLIHQLIKEEELNYAKKEADSLSKSLFDFDSIPFGISKKSFLVLAENKYNLKPVDMDYYIYFNALPLGGRNFLIAFYFDKKNYKLYKYEIESVPLEPSQFNRAVRADADYIANEFEKRFGPPLRRESVGFFDIKSNILTPYKIWKADGFDAVIVGFSLHEHKYYSKALVVKTSSQ
jgi:hypothetical protein